MGKDGKTRKVPGRFLEPVWTATGGSLIVVLLLASGCTAPSAMSSAVRYNGSIGADRTVQALHVGVAREGRPDGGESRIGIGFITFIPLVLYAPQRFTPERYYANAAMIQYNFRDDLSQTIVKDLTAAGLARSVGFNTFGGVTAVPSDIYRLDLTLKEGIWNRNFTTYGCSIMGVYLWVFGLPVSYGSADLSFEAVVYAPGGEELGRRAFGARLPLTESIYVPHKFPRRLPLLYEQISPDLRHFVRDCLKRGPSGEARVETRPPVPTEISADKPVGVQADTLVGKLEKLKEMRERGILTEEEYQSKRKKLVDEF